jgi:hypothetical protein
VFTTDIDRHLANRFEERQRFDITHGTADLNQNDVMTFAAFIDALFDGVGVVWDILNRGAQLVTERLFAQIF